VRARARARVALALIFRTSARLRMLIIVFALPCEVCMLYSSGESRARCTDANNRERKKEREEATRDTLGGNFKSPEGDRILSR